MCNLFIKPQTHYATSTKAATFQLRHIATASQSLLKYGQFISDYQNKMKVIISGHHEGTLQIIKY